MHRHRTAAGRAPARTVTGLGVCDALRLELRAVQLPWLIDELEEMRGPLEEALRRPPAIGEDEPDAAALQEELRILRRLRAQLPASRHPEPVVVVGPTAILQRIVRATLCSVTAALAEFARERPAPDARRLRAAAVAARAWTRTYLDCRAVETFTFEL